MYRMRNDISPCRCGVSFITPFGRLGTRLAVVLKNLAKHGTEGSVNKTLVCTYGLYCPQTISQIFGLRDNQTFSLDRFRETVSGLCHRWVGRSEIRGWRSYDLKEFDCGNRIAVDERCATKAGGVLGQ